MALPHTIADGPSADVNELDANFAYLDERAKNITSDLSGNVLIGSAKWFGVNAGASYTPDDGVFGGVINNGGGFKIRTASVDRIITTAAGNTNLQLQVGATPPLANQMLVINMLSNTQIRLTVRGTDGADRYVNLDLVPL